MWWITLQHFDFARMVDRVFYWNISSYAAETKHNAWYVFAGRNEHGNCIMDWTKLGTSASAMTILPS